jgi:hypothetical protein
LFKVDYGLDQRGFHTNYCTAPDGRFVMIQRSEEAEKTTQLVLVLNWFQELKRLVPTN